MPVKDRQKIDAVKFLIAQDMSQPQIDEVKRRIEYYDENPQELVSWDEVRTRLNFG